MITESKPAAGLAFDSYKLSTWKHFGAAIDMLENAIEMCPPQLWDNDKKFWYKSFHVLFYLDYYLALNPETFSPPAPFTSSELDKTMPPRSYTKEELLWYVKHGKEKLHSLMKIMNEDIALKRWINPDRDYTMFEMLIYNMRHVQHHAAQLNLLLRLEIDNAPPWVAEGRM